jgi:hypothetical protein
VTRRLALFGMLVLAAAGQARAYPWPVKPFYREHPIGGTFGDPRMVFKRTLGDDALNGPGRFYFHNGVDIHARPGTPVYPIFSGLARRLSGSAVAVGSPGRPTFQYYHLKLGVRSGSRVVARRTVLGWITRAAGHVHLSEIYGGRDLNPLAPGRLEPYRDWTRPHVREIDFRDVRGKPISPLGMHGGVDVFADAYDLPVQVGAFSLGLPVTPAVVSWRLRTLGGRVVRRTQTPVDFRFSEPPNWAFWRIYGRGTYPNGPIFGGQLYKKMPGRYLFRLTPHGLDTRSLADGTYVITVTARDVRGNRGSMSQRFEILNGRR